MAWPTTLISIKKSETLDLGSTPSEYLEGHRWPDGIWVMVRVLEGQLTLETSSGREALTRAVPGFVEPADRAKVTELSADVRYFLEFFAEPSAKIDDF